LGSLHYTQPLKLAKGADDGKAIPASGRQELPEGEDSPRRQRHQPLQDAGMRCGHLQQPRFAIPLPNPQGHPQATRSPPQSNRLRPTPESVTCAVPAGVMATRAGLAVRTTRVALDSGATAQPGRAHPLARKDQQRRRRTHLAHVLRGPSPCQ
jgi:hypothetical protein